MDNPVNSDAHMAEDERSSGKRKLEEASEGDLSDEEGFPTGRVRRMRVSETADKNGGASGGVNAAETSELVSLLIPVFHSNGPTFLYCVLVGLNVDTF